MSDDALVSLVIGGYVGVIALFVMAAHRLEERSHAIERAQRWEHLTRLRMQLIEEEEAQLDSKEVA